MNETERQAFTHFFDIMLVTDVGKARRPILVRTLVDGMEQMIELIKAQAYEQGKDAMQEAMEEME